MFDLRDLYQEVILDHNKRPRNFGQLKEPERSAEGYNPLCGDKLIVHLGLKGDVICEIAFTGSGCAISKASASLMTESVKGKTLAEVRTLSGRFQEMVTAAYPARVKCAVLAWRTLRAAIEADHKVATTE